MWNFERPLDDPQVIRARAANNRGWETPQHDPECARSHALETSSNGLVVYPCPR